MLSEEPKYRLGDFVSISDCSFVGVIIGITVSDSKEWPHKYKVQGRTGALTFNEDSIILKGRHNYEL